MMLNVTTQYVWMKIQKDIFLLHISYSLPIDQENSYMDVWL